MKILFSLDNYDHGTGGAEMSIRTLAHLLNRRGHDVEVLQCAEREGVYDDGSIRVHTRTLPLPRFIRDKDRDTIRWNRAWGKKLEAFLDRNSFDLIMTQNRLLYSTVYEAKERRIPVVVFVRAFSMFCPTQFRSCDPLSQCDRLCDKCLPLKQRFKSGLIKRNLGQYEQGLRMANLVVANSHYMSRVIKRFYNLEAEVSYPFIERYKCKPDKLNQKGILFVKPQYVKGFPIFIKIAARMPDTHFLVAGKVGRHARMKLRHLKNVECMGWVKDMRSAYARAKVLLGPSLWPEPFGRVFVEAAINGIPSIASARGGIPEAVGEGGLLIEDIFDIDRWVKTLYQFENPDHYAFYSVKAFENAKRFISETGLEAFITSVQKKTGIEL